MQVICILFVSVYGCVCDRYQLDTLQLSDANKVTTLLRPINAAQHYDGSAQEDISREFGVILCAFCSVTVEHCPVPLQQC